VTAERFGSGDIPARSRTRVSVSSVTEKAFLDGYRGQTLDELLTMTDTYREDSIILAIEQALQQKAPTDLTPPEHVVLAVEALEREVNNGRLQPVLPERT
jgi:hypothetical protein